MNSFLIQFSVELLDGDRFPVPKQMRFFLFLATLLLVAHCAIYSKLSTQLGNVLTASDYLMSTLGLFRMTLAPATCQLQIENFTNNTYAIIGYFPRQALPPCQSLAITSNSILSNNNDIILSLQAAQIRTVFDEVLATIDEMGIIRINGVYSKRYESSQNWISLFRTPRQFVYSISNLSVTVYSSLSFIQNGGNWGFSATNGELRLFRIDDVTKIVRYNYTSFTITPNNLFDYNSNSLPQANYNEFRYYSTCSPSGYLENFQGPFVFVINPYWPELRLIDRTGYEIISLRYPSPHCLSLNATSTLHRSDNCMTWFCPQNTFELNGDCLAACPLPYFHQLGKNGVNRCVINCQATLTKDAVRRVCACGQLPVPICPSSLRSAPLGCLCPKGSFYNPYNQLVESAGCSSTCGPFLFAHKDGLCVPCPPKCEICQLSQNSFAYLFCSRCQQGFSPNPEGFCVPNCQQAQGNTTVCPNCTIPNCDECSQAGCVSCSRPYSLFNGSCLVQCPRGFKAQFERQKGFTCVLVAGCPAQSTLVSGVNNQSACFCTRNGNPSYSKSCGTATAASCSFDSYFDAGTQECLACPVGCLTCLLDKSSRLECTSCRPDYSLFVTVSRNHYCERNSILSICPNLYDPIRQLCSITAINQTLSALPMRTLCLASLSRCLVCVVGGLQCSLCASGWLLLGGLCVQACPNGMTPYQFQSICLPIQNENCLKEVTQNAYWLFIRNRANLLADGYFHLITANFQAIDFLNDPVGSIFTLSTAKGPEAQRPRLVSIATSFQRCTLCAYGYGLSGNGCQRCASPCLQCTFYSQSSSFCLRCDSEHRLANNSCVRLNLTELPCKQGEYRNESLICQPQCLTFQQNNRTIFQGGRPYEINCTANCPLSVLPLHDKQGTLHLSCTSSSELKQHVMFLGSVLTMPSKTVYFLVSTVPLVYDSDFAPSVSKISTEGRRLSESSEGTTVYTTKFGLVVAVDGAGDGLVLRLPAAKLRGAQGNIYLSNSIYGFDKTSQSFMDRLLSTTSLYIYGRAYVVAAFMLTLVFVAGGVSYKTDNLFATFSVLYLALPSLNLRPDSSAFSAYSFLYGFSWSALLELFSNPRSLSKSTRWFDGYLQNSNSNAHYLLFVDSNLLRNGWSIILVLLGVGVPLALIALGMRFLAVRPFSGQWQCSKVGFHWQDVDHSQQVRSFILFLVENALMGLTYYSLLTVFSQSQQLASPEQQLPFRIVGGIILAAIVVYCGLRAYASRVGGVYSLKRMLLGLTLALASECGGVDQNAALTMSLLIAIELLFVVLRYRAQFVTHYLSTLCKNTRTMVISKTKVKTRHTIAEGQRLPSVAASGQPQEGTKQGKAFWTMVVEEALIILAYIFLVLSSWLGQVSVVVIWGVLNVFMVSFGVDFVDLLVDYWDKWYGRQIQPENPFSRRIRNNWDHELSCKSLSTNDL